MEELQRHREAVAEGQGYTISSQRPVLKTEGWLDELIQANCSRSSSGCLHS